MLLNFSLLHVQGLLTKYTNKLQSDELIKIFQNNDIILVTEVWTNDLCDVSVDEFSVFSLKVQVHDQMPCNRLCRNCSCY